MFLLSWFPFITIGIVSPINLSSPKLLWLGQSKTATGKETKTGMHILFPFHSSSGKELKYLLKLERQKSFQARKTNKQSNKTVILGNSNSSHCTDFYRFQSIILMFFYEIWITPHALFPEQLQGQDCKLDRNLKIIKQASNERLIMLVRHGTWWASLCSWALVLQVFTTVLHSFCLVWTLVFLFHEPTCSAPTLLMVESYSLFKVNCEFPKPGAILLIKLLNFP